MDGEGVGVILGLPAEPVGEARHAAHSHASGQIRPLYVAGADLGHVRGSHDGVFTAPVHSIGPYRRWRAFSSSRTP